ncbi:MAG: hypothetical protein K5761_00750 [Clostridiales bacterium]|nr:hypothetical protein [Clostridiales bacterium]
MRKVLLTLLLVLSMTIQVSAEEIRIPNTPTITPIRIFFAVFIVILFIAGEILFAYFRRKRIESRPERYEKKMKELEEKKKARKKQ